MDNSSLILEKTKHLLCVTRLRTPQGIYLHFLLRWSQFDQLIFQLKPNSSSVFNSKKITE